MIGPSWPRRGAPHTFGCVRVPALDHHGWRCWERPGGTKLWLHESVARLVQMLPSLLPEPDYARANDPA